jgi:CTP:molybdopterin cytidylyltransferase MocA
MGRRPEPSLPIGVVVLAAGAATRFGSPKQRLLLPHVLRRLEDTGLTEIVVVQGAYPVEAPGARVVTAADWELGPGASLRAGLQALPAETEAAVVVLADGPALAPGAVRRLLEAWRRGAAPVVAASYGGERSHPLVLARSAWGSIPTEGLRSIPVALVACDDLGSPGDVDTPADLGPLGLAGDED